jgi:hypothetical protein
MGCMTLRVGYASHILLILRSPVEYCRLRMVVTNTYIVKDYIKCQKDVLPQISLLLFYSTITCLET